MPRKRPSQRTRTPLTPEQVRRAKAPKGKQPDFEKDILPFVDSLYSTAYRLVMNHQDAEDLVQETCMKAFKYYDKFEQGTNLRAWLFKILKNTFINNYRKRKATPQQVDFSGIEESLENLITENIKDQWNPESLYFSTLIDDNVDRAMKSLPSEYNVVVMLADIEGKSYKEISDALKIPLGTVMSRLYRGRKMLEKALLEYGISHGYLRHGPPSKIRKKELLGS